jgi:CBS domain-containing protein
MSAPELIVESTIRDLKGYEPFARLTRDDLRFFASRARLAYFPVGTVIVDAATGAAGDLHVIRQGHVRSEDPTIRGTDVVLGPGECFPLIRLAADTAGVGTFTATEDVFCWQLGREDFGELRARSAPFAEFCAQALASIVRRSVAQLRQNFGSRAIEHQTLLRPLEALVRREPVRCTRATALADALATMRRERVATIVVVDEVERPVGVFTLRDLRDRVVLDGVPLTAPIDAVMTPRAGALDALATAQDAIALMAERGWHQVLVTRAGRLIGVVSERDLFALQRVSMRNVLTAIDAACSVAELRAVTEDIDALADNLVAQGAAAGPLTHAIAALNDAVTHRLFALLTPRHSLEGIEWCWLALGSEGRREQTVASDQDNALVFTTAGDRDAARARLLAFANEINVSLAAVGVPLCPGNIMARNPEGCLALEEWQQRFVRWIREPTPLALLNANIYFDLRPLAGEIALADRLRDYVLGLTTDNRLFLRMLTANALQAEPPLGVIRSFRTDEGAHAGTVDLKTHGTRIFVDAARAFALGLGIPETNTVQRLRLAARRLNLEDRDTEALVDAFEYLQMLRLRVQRGGLDPDAHESPATESAPASQPDPARNRLDPYALNELDRRLLKEAFRQARSLQQLLERSLGQ